jgi:hypothetical protein
LIRERRQPRAHLHCVGQQQRAVLHQRVLADGGTEIRGGKRVGELPGWPDALLPAPGFFLKPLHPNPL